MSSEEFNEKIKQNDINTNEIKKIYVEKNILSPFDSPKIIKFKLELNASVLIHSSSSSQNLIREISEYQQERDMQEKSKEYIDYIGSIGQNIDNNINNNSKSVIIDISKINDNNYIEMQLYLGKNILFLFNIQKRLIIIGSFLEKDNNNYVYYNLKLHLIIKFNQLDLSIVKREIEEFKGYASLNEYICKKNSGNKNINRALFFNQDINDLYNNINNNHKNNQINKTNDFKQKLLNNLDDKNKITNNEIINKKRELNSDNNNLISNHETDNINYINNNEKNEEKENNKETAFGSDLLNSQIINNNINNRRPEENPIRFRAHIEIGDKRNNFNSLNTAQIEKKNFWTWLKAIIILIIAYLFPQYINVYMGMIRNFSGANK